MQKNSGDMSKTRAVYFMKLVGRCIILLIAVGVYIFDTDSFNIALGMNFFRGFSPFHILWCIWLWDMILQLMPVRAHISIGSQKVFQSLFRPIKEKVNPKSLKKYIIDTSKAAYKVMIIWVILSFVIGALYVKGVIDSGIVVLISVLFYVCDLSCVLIWCPLRLLSGLYGSCAFSFIPSGSGKTVIWHLSALNVPISSALSTAEN